MLSIAQLHLLSLKKETQMSPEGLQYCWLYTGFIAIQHELKTIYGSYMFNFVPVICA